MTASANRLEQTTDEGRQRTRTTSNSERLVNNVYQQLRYEIVTGILRPNQPIVEADIAERLAVSRTPVRESLQQLASDGLVVSKRRRWVVYEHTADEVQEIYEVRAALEAAAASLACERATPKELGEIVTVGEKATRIERVERDERVKVNDAFHNLVINAAGNARLACLIESNRHFYFNRQIAMLYGDDDLAESSKQHQELIEALKERDGERAARITCEHIFASLKLAVEKLYR